MNYRVKKLSLLNIKDTFAVARILTDCGKDMNEKYGLKHWYNAFFKTWLIVYYSALGNTVYGVFDGSSMIATFQVKKKEESLGFTKLAVSPKASGRGIGSFCLNEIERLAALEGVSKLTCEVYDKSAYAISFYEKRGFLKKGETQTRKYTEILLEKELKEVKV